MAESKKTMVLGATPNPERFAYRAVIALKKKDHEVIPVGIRKGDIEGIAIQDFPEIDQVHTITLYMNAERQKPYYSYILDHKPERLIFNPGAENPELKKLAEERGIAAEYACTLIMLAAGSY